MTDAPKPCSRCHDEPSGQGGILGARCLAELQNRTLDDMYGKGAGGEDHD